MLGNIIPYIKMKSTFNKHKKGHYIFLSRKEVKELYAMGKARRNKGISMVEKLKSVLRKTGVNGLVMRMASVLKQNIYRKK